MKFQQGDKVILTHSGEEGEIVEFINKDMAIVDVNGVRFPVYLDQIDFPYFQRFTAKPEVKPKKKVFIDEVRKEKVSRTAAYKLSDGVWLSFLPVFDKDVFDDDVVEYFRLYLVNQTDHHFKFSYWLRLAGTVDFELKNDILPLSDFYLHDVQFEKLNDAPRFDFDFSLDKPDKKKADHFEANLKLKPKQVFMKIGEIRMKQEASFSYQLFQNYPDRSEEEKTDLSKLANAGYKIYEGGRIHRQLLEPARSVLDLHIEKLTDNWKHINKKEVLELQLRTFEKFYELALLHHLKQMIVIHGVGTGRLREEIHEILRLKKDVKSFVNQFHPLYGFGATEIYFS
jgi:Smr domain